jgi:hypothetical protein
MVRTNKKRAVLEMIPEDVVVATPVLPQCDCSNCPCPACQDKIALTSEEIEGLMKLSDETMAAASRVMTRLMSLKPKSS